jgi:threonyl-tRNA synthetase
LSNAKFAKEKLSELKKSLEKEGFEVHKSPFGWYKEFIVHCKGHPLAEANRQY